MLKKNGGITLIALVITIIVLLILAGVSIAMLTGENGLLNRSTSAAKKERIAGVKDSISTQVAATGADWYEARYAGNATVSAAAGDSIDTYIKTNLDLSKIEKDGCTVSTTDLSTSGTITVSFDGVSATGTLKDGALSWAWDE